MSCWQGVLNVIFQGPPKAPALIFTSPMTASSAWSTADLPHQAVAYFHHTPGRVPPKPIRRGVVPAQRSRVPAQYRRSPISPFPDQACALCMAQKLGEVFARTDRLEDLLAQRPEELNAVCRNTFANVFTTHYRTMRPEITQPAASALQRRLNFIFEKYVLQEPGALIHPVTGLQSREHPEEHFECSGPCFSHCFRRQNIVPDGQRVHQ